MHRDQRELAIDYAIEDMITSAVESTVPICCTVPMTLAKDSFRGQVIFYACYECGRTLSV